MRADKCTFGWQTINNLYQREVERVSQNLTRMVPRLREAHCLHDAWTKLNVHPAKIMQVSWHSNILTTAHSKISIPLNN